MLEMEELIFGIATAGVPSILFLLTLGFIFDYFRIFLFKD